MKQIYISVNLSKPKKTNKNQQIEIILKIQRDLVSKTVISCYINFRSTKGKVEKVLAQISQGKPRSKEIKWSIVKS